MQWGQAWLICFGSNTAALLCMIACVCQAQEQKSFWVQVFSKEGWVSPFRNSIFLVGDPFIVLTGNGQSGTVCVCSVAQLCLILCDPIHCSPTGSFVHEDSPGKNTGMGCHVLLQGIFSTQGLNPGLPHCRWILYYWATREAKSWDMRCLLKINVKHRIGPRGATSWKLLTKLPSAGQQGLPKRAVWRRLSKWTTITSQQHWVSK